MGIPLSVEVAGEQIGIDAFDLPFEKLVLCEHALYSEWISLEMGQRFFSAGRVVDEKPSRIVREWACQRQAAGALKRLVVLPMRRANSGELRFVSGVLRVAREQSISLDQKIATRPAKTPSAYLEAA
jgi:hypothetical protein